MKPFKILGIYRHPLFSNNAIEADRLILQQSIAQLQQLSPLALDIDMIEEAEAANHGGTYDLVLTMAQSEDSLRAIERNFGGSPVWNSSAAIRNCYRKTMSRTLIELPVGYVPFQVLLTNEAPPALPEGSYWLKRSDFHAIADEDVTLAESAEEIRTKLARFRERGVQEVIVQRHITGDIYKFYGVKGKFFRAIKVRSFLPAGAPGPDLAKLERSAHQAAEALGVVIFGGDCVVDAEGRAHLIDLNDWPSFRICREDASRAIGQLAAEHLQRALEARRAAPASVIHA